jgi:hypothetical protein
VQAYDEPAYTKTSGNNAYWFAWQSVDGTDSNGNTMYTYYICFRTERNGVPVETSNGSNGPGSQNCTGNLRNSSGQPTSGNYGVMPFAANTVLDDGANYVFCALDYNQWPFIWHSLGPTSCEGTRIDRNKPSVAVSPNGPGATNNGTLPFRIDYGDPTSPPWPANYRCIKLNSACTAADQFTYDPNCSVPAGNGFVFFCNLEAGGASDGRYYLCAAASDSAIPDNPNGTNQFITGSPSRPVNSTDSNISDRACGSILLDRVAPQVSIAPSATTVTVGDLVNFSASATDDSSGLAGGYAWNFGDNTPGDFGSSVSHTYTQVGTFQARVTTQDAAGNAGTSNVNITVKAAPAGSGGGSGTGGTVGTPPTAGQIGSQVGGGGTQKTAVGGLRVVAPKRLSTRVCKGRGRRRKCSRPKTLPMSLSPDDAGKVDVALVRGSRVLAKASATFRFAGTYGLKMRLPRNLKAGNHSLRITYTPRSAPASRKNLRLKVVGPKPTSRRSVASSASRRPRIRGSAPYQPNIAAMRRAQGVIRIR